MPCTHYIRFLFRINIRISAHSNNIQILCSDYQLHIRIKFASVIQTVASMGIRFPGYIGIDMELFDRDYELDMVMTLSISLPAFGINLILRSHCSTYPNYNSNVCTIRIKSNYYTLAGFLSD